MSFGCSLMRYMIWCQLLPFCWLTQKKTKTNSSGKGKGANAYFEQVSPHLKNLDIHANFNVKMVLVDY